MSETNSVSLPTETVLNTSEVIVTEGVSLPTQQPTFEETLAKLVSQSILGNKLFLDRVKQQVLNSVQQSLLPKIVDELEGSIDIDDVASELASNISSRELSDSVASHLEDELDLDEIAECVVSNTDLHNRVTESVKDTFDLDDTVDSLVQDPKFKAALGTAIVEKLLDK